ncbi:MAG: efflux RND transporter periplasmic adaptor subunit [Bdellovibrionota bacterium]|nr:efflux RND transporter periplasmic adaptor subunit [Pseudomonadota bacterium]MDY6090650.1 efflux RND transporter periplasmic adaptor subunit [Bdellovibrionota bacterium]
MTKYKNISKSLNIVLKSICIFIVSAFIISCNNEDNPKQTRLEVDYAILQAQDLRLTKELPGRVSAFNVSQVRPQVSGIIKERLFEEGSDVKEGDVLYRIDPALFQTAYNSAKANLEGKEAILGSTELLAERYERLIKTHAVSKQDYDDVMARYKQAKADVDSAREMLENAKINLDYTEVRSPISGRIGRSFVTVGALVTANQPNYLSTVQQLTPVYVDVTQSTTELIKLQRELFNGSLYLRGEKSANVKLKLEDGSFYTTNIDYTITGEKPDYIIGKLLFSDITVSESTSAVTLRILFENPQNMLLPGMYVTAIVEEGVREKSILVPQSATLKTTKSEPYVYILTKETPKDLDDKQDGNEDYKLKDEEYYVVRRNIEIDRDYKNNWLVSSGLEDSELLLLNGYQKVHAGMIVKVKNNLSEKIKISKNMIKSNLKNGVKNNG